MFTSNCIWWNAILLYIYFSVSSCPQSDCYFSRRTNVVGLLFSFIPSVCRLKNADIYGWTNDVDRHNNNNKVWTTSKLFWQIFKASNLRSSKSIFNFFTKRIFFLKTNFLNIKSIFRLFKHNSKNIIKVFYHFYTIHVIERIPSK